MLKVTGTTKVETNIAAVEKLLNGIIPDGSTAALECKLDARGNVKSTFLKTDKKDKNKFAIYTGAVSTEWDTGFASGDGVGSEEEALLFIAIYGLLKTLGGTPVDMKVSAMSTIRVEDDFAQVKKGFPEWLKKFTAMKAETPTAAPAATKAKKTVKAGSKVNPNAAKPLTDVPEVNLPDDLDLTKDELAKAASAASKNNPVVPADQPVAEVEPLKEEVMNTPVEEEATEKNKEENKEEVAVPDKAAEEKKDVPEEKVDKVKEAGEVPKKEKKVEKKEEKKVEDQPSASADEGEPLIV